MSSIPNLPPDAFQSYTSTQIVTPTLFATAIKDLPLETLYAKAAELQNSISHLLSSNIQMKPFADEGDADCKEAIEENDETIRRFEERIELCKRETEERGVGWSVHGGNTEEVVKVNGAGGVNGEASGERQTSGRLTDEELRRQLEAQMDGEEEDGVHL